MLVPPLLAFLALLPLLFVPSHALVDLSAELEQDQGYNDNPIAHALHGAEFNTNVEAYAVLHGGKLVAETYFHGNDRSTKFNMNSVTKNFAEMLVAILIDRGNLSLSMTLEEVLQPLDVNWGNVTSAEQKKNITLESVLTMTSGLIPDYVDNPMNFWMKPQSTVEEMLNDGVFEEGRKGEFHYLTSTHVLAYVILAATGEDPQAYGLGGSGAFPALGMSYPEDFWWNNDDVDQNWGGPREFIVGADAYGIYTTLRNLAKLGQLYLQGGQASASTRLFSSSYASESTGVRVGPWDSPPDLWLSGCFPDGLCPASDVIFHVGYGYRWYMMSDGGDLGYYCGFGYGGNCICVYPSVDVVLAVTGSDPATYEGMCRVMEQLYLALTATTTTTASNVSATTSDEDTADGAVVAKVGRTVIGAAAFIGALSG